MFGKVLIANRGEIAVRIMRTCHEMDIGTVAVYSEADALASHVLEAEEAVFLGGAQPSESYLNMDRILAAARSRGAEAIHPGYGFLAENADFAERCEAEGIAFIGPPGRVIRDLGDKTKARRIMEAAGVPVIPGMTAAATDTGTLLEEAKEIGYPVLLKAAFGGGGKGMRVVSGPENLVQEVLSAESEAEKAFGNGALYLEKALNSPRHVEVQILADRYGHVIHLFERECSVQRRHQKIIEETPSPGIGPSLRDQLGKAAVAAATAAGYKNAGTVEFLVDQAGRFHFLEVNTRLQVEHPVTEMTTGIDLVRHQIEIAHGNPLSLAQGDIVPRGHAIECRIYAEDPEAGFIPSSGRVAVLREPSGPGIRNDCGIYEGSVVPVEYDPILSKLVATGETREAARMRMVGALKQFVVLGIRTTISFLLELVQSEAFIAGRTTTDFIERHFETRSFSPEGSDLAAIAYVLDGFHQMEEPSRAPERRTALTPWDTLGPWRI